MIKIVGILFLICLLSRTTVACHFTDTASTIKKDSTKIINTRSFYLATNFQQLINFHNTNNFNLDITSRVNLTRNKSVSNYRSKQEANIELSFTKYIDSIVEISDDVLELRSNWDFQFKDVKNAININIKSQMTNSYDYIFIQNELMTVLSKQPLFPAIFNLGTGFNFTFSEGNLVNFSPVDIKTTVLSDKISVFYPEHKKLIPGFFFITEIGSSVTVSINTTWARKLLSWRNSSRVFVKDLTKDGTTIYSKNRIMYEIYRSINISFENNLVYDPIYNYKLQMKNEIVLGISFRK